MDNVKDSAELAIKYYDQVLDHLRPGAAVSSGPAVQPRPRQDWPVADSENAERG